MKLTLLFSFLFSFVASCGNQDQSTAVAEAGAQMAEPTQGTPGYFVNTAGDTIYQVVKTASEWKAELTSEEFHILREAGTERAGTGVDLLKEKRPGNFTCAACGLVLFDAATKFESGTGWPSFFAPADGTHVGEETDRAYGMVRTEVLCNRCGGHLGHVFPDGPAPTGLRYCINAASMDFVPTTGEE